MPTLAPAITTVRFQWVTGKNPLSRCTESADLRCPHFLGAVQDDHHKTLWEADVAPNSPLVGFALADAPIINKIFQGEITLADALAGPLLNSPFVAAVEPYLGPFEPFMAQLIEDITGGFPRFCILDKTAPAGDICPE